MMKWPWRRRPLPEEVRDSVHLLPGERIMSAEETVGGGYVVASDTALHLIPSSDGAGCVRVRWDLIDSAAWHPPTLVLALARTDGAPVEHVSVDLPLSAGLPRVVRDRVTGSIVVNEQVRIGASQVRILGRRHSESQRLEWRVVPGRGVDPTDPAVAEAIASALAPIRAHWE